MKKFQLTLMAASFVLLGACATKPAEPAKVVPPPEKVTLEQLNKAVDEGKKIQNEKGEEVVCRREAKIGSRLARETICMTRAEWLALSEEAQRSTKKSMRTGRIPHGS